MRIRTQHRRIHPGLRRHQPSRRRGRELATFPGRAGEKSDPARLRRRQLQPTRVAHLQARGVGHHAGHRTAAQREFHRPHPLIARRRIDEEMPLQRVATGERDRVRPAARPDPDNLGPATCIPRGPGRTPRQMAENRQRRQPVRSLRRVAEPLMHTPARQPPRTAPHSRRLQRQQHSIHRVPSGPHETSRDVPRPLQRSNRCSQLLAALIGWTT